MTINAALAAVVDDVEKTILDRHEKYGPRNISRSPGGPLNGLRVRLYDKLARLNNFVDNGGQADFADDSLRDCFVDICGYALIGLLVLDGDWPDSADQPAEKPVGITTIPVIPAKAAVTVGGFLTGHGSPTQTHRWSKLAPQPSNRLDEDAWPTGTTFRADGSSLLWTRHGSGWATSAHSYHYPGLSQVFVAYGYTDGTITEPA